MHFIRLIRPVNLLIIAATMYVMRWCVMIPILDAFPGMGKFRLELQSASLDFFLLTLSTLFIAAAGNIINDYFDIRADRINKPQQVIVGKYIKRRIAMSTHVVFNILGILLAIYLAFKSRIWILPLFHIFTASALWFYCVNFKKKALIGNLLIALSTALVPALVAAYDMPLLARQYENTFLNFFSDLKLIEDPKAIGHQIMYGIMSYAFFAFLTTLVREIQKDAADIEGDSAVGGKTLPVILGIRRTKFLIAGLLILIITLLLVIGFIFLQNIYPIAYVAGAVIAPLIVSMVTTLKAQQRHGFLLASNWMKVSMVAALLFAYLAGYLFPENPLITNL